MRLVPYTVRPLGPWIGARTVDPGRGPFGRATWQSTLELISHELRMVGADRWVLQIDVAERWINRDGSLHANAKPNSEAVRVSFESDHGPLMFATDRFDRWQINVRACASTMEDLRRIDRYGVANSGEQYRGFAAIESRPAELTRGQAVEFIAHWAGLDALERSRLVVYGMHEELKAAYYQAAKRIQASADANDDTMARLNVARDLLAGPGGGVR